MRPHTSIFNMVNLYFNVVIVFNFKYFILHFLIPEFINYLFLVFLYFHVNELLFLLISIILLLNKQVDTECFEHFQIISQLFVLIVFLRACVDIYPIYRISDALFFKISKLYTI